MQNCTDFNKLYKKELLKCLLIAIPLSIIALFFFLNVLNNYMFIVCFALNCIIICVPFSLFNDRINEYLIKRKILPYLKNEINKNISYDKNNCKEYIPSTTPLNKSFGTYFHRWYNIHNVISGKINNICFHIADTNSKASFGGFSHVNFYGQIIELNFDKKESNERIIIRPKKIFNSNSFSGLNLNEQYSTNNFIVYGNTNDVLLYKLRQLIIFLENYKNKTIYAYISNDKVFVMINSNKSLLEQFNFLNVGRFNYNNINSIINLIKILTGQI